MGDHCEYEDRENQETNCVFLTQVRSVKEILHGSYSLTINTLTTDTIVVILSAWHVAGAGWSENLTKVE